MQARGVNRHPLTTQGLTRSKHFLEKWESALLKSSLVRTYREFPKLVQTIPSEVTENPSKSSRFGEQTFGLKHFAACKQSSSTDRGKAMECSRWMTCFSDAKGCGKLRLLVTVSKGEPCTYTGIRDLSCYGTFPEMFENNFIYWDTSGAIVC